MNQIFNDTIRDEVVGTRDRDFARARHSSHSAGPGHSGSAKYYLVYATNCAYGRGWILIGNVIENVLKLVYGGHCPADFQAFSSTARLFTLFPCALSRAQESIILPTSS